MNADASARALTTELLVRGDPDDPATLDRLLPHVYAELRRMAHRELAGEKAGHTLQTTALVHEAYLKLVDDTRVTSRGRSYFFAAASRAMRQVLVDHARRHGAAKRGGGAIPETLEDHHLEVSAFATHLIDLDRALDVLAERSPRQARVVECRYFGGLTVQETAEALDVSPRTVKYDWSMARAWLYDRLTSR